VISCLCFEKQLLNRTSTIFVFEVLKMWILAILTCYFKQAWEGGGGKEKRKLFFTTSIVLLSLEMVNCR